jgi:hypothetical protein
MKCHTAFDDFVDDILSATSTLELSDIRSRIVQLTSFTQDSYFRLQEIHTLNTLMYIQKIQLEFPKDRFPE